MTKSKSSPVVPSVRVAIYARQSVANDLEYGSIDAQREAVEAYVASQRGEGWVALPDRFDDHGFSGGNTDRPALQRLLADIEGGKVDVIATYKIDRVSRSLADFTRFMEVLEQHGVGFVSTTQSFDTRSSMGRLTLNILASFSQFEREVISERTRDKIVATRRKGLWTGGRPVLGYDIMDKALVVNTIEAEMVRTIFQLYLDHGGLVTTVGELDRRGIRNKSWVNKAGKHVRGSVFKKDTLRTLLTNPLYIGKMRCGDEVVEGRHEAIVDASLLEEVASALRDHRRTTRSPGKWGALLTGILRCRCGAAMTHAANVRGNSTYRYYCCVKMQKEGAAACPGSRAPAGGIEDVVTSRIRALGTDPSVILATITAAKRAHRAQEPGLIAESRRIAIACSKLSSERKNLLDALQNGGVAANAIAGRIAEVDQQIGKLEAKGAEVAMLLMSIANDTVDETALREALAEFAGLWDELLSKEKARILRLLIEEVRYDGRAGELEIIFRDHGIRALGREITERRTA